MNNYLPYHKILIIREGREVPVKQPGIQKATCFVILPERGKGDTIQETEQYWGNTDIEEIYGRIIDWKAETK